jgi:transcriptional regulator with XRE-family HTH domain
MAVFVSVATELMLARLAMGFGETRFAEMLGISQPTVSEFERGNKPVPRVALERYCDLRGWGFGAVPGYLARQQWDLALRSIFRADPGLERAFFVCAGEELVALWPLVVENTPDVPGAVDLPALEALRSARGVEDLASPGRWAALRWVLEAVLSRSALVSGGAVLRFGSAAGFVAAVRDVLDAGGSCGCSVLPGLRLVDLCCLVFPRIEVVQSGSAWGLGFVLAGVSGRCRVVSAGA